VDKSWGAQSSGSTQFIASPAQQKININTAINVAINSAYEKKYYELTPSITGSYIVETFGSIDTILNLMNLDRTSVANGYNDDWNYPANGRNAKITIQLVKGKTYVLETYLWSAGMGSFTFIVNENIQSLSLNTSTLTTINSAGGYFHYNFTPSVSGTYAFETTGSLDTFMYLYDNKGNQLTYNDDWNYPTNGRNARIVYSLTAGTTYKISLRFYSNSVVGSFYTIVTKL
jgi:hypothetical protein